ncbi:hypothetical protein DSM106972_097630 [Dulcicalothrix desertica PCC 7102]|uniref:Uncharacterized protein n=1 Tax=Dulcicalothrix desertica PCC 7102 TaxID=232991 RepID=A0A433UGR2_9CYAN|nr:hypothetical protein DSM106972_097630 [Dulcicalothrix desertica PCC 7102]TWH61348.1 hypothetical protein CAL7102_00894 [Dulcicalothrix desertica PCC 7102]
MVIFTASLLKLKYYRASDSNVVWGNAEAIYNTLNQISGEPIHEEVHYSQKSSFSCIKED